MAVLIWFWLQTLIEFVSFTHKSIESQLSWGSVRTMFRVYEPFFWSINRNLVNVPSMPKYWSCPAKPPDVLQVFRTWGSLGCLLKSMGTNDSGNQIKIFPFPPKYLDKIYPCSWFEKLLGPTVTLEISLSQARNVIEGVTTEFRTFWCIAYLS